jgi:hypothetical protein
LRSSVATEVFFKTDKNNQPQKGVLLNLLQDGTKFLAVISGDNKCFLVPSDCCVAVGTQTCFNDDTLRVYFDAASATSADVEISYLTSGITRKHLCRISVSGQSDSVDICSKVFLKNNTDADLENAKISFGRSQLSSSRTNSFDDTCICNNVSIKKHSGTVCVLKSLKEQKTKLEYLVNIPAGMLAHNTVQDASVKNLLIVEDVAKLGLGLDLSNGELLLYQRINDGERFLGQYPLSSFVKNNALVIEMGTTDEIFAKVQQPDFRKLSEKQSEYGIQVSVQNKKSTESDVCVVLDINSVWKVTKKNSDMQPDSKPSWKMNLGPNELKELHFRIRVTN